MNKQLIIQLIIIFVLTQGIGLYAGNFMIEQDIHTTLVTDNPDDVENSIGLMGCILRIILCKRFVFHLGFLKT